VKMIMLMFRVFGATLDDDDDDREAENATADETDDEAVNTDDIDNPTNLFSSATGQCSIRLHFHLVGPGFTFCLLLKLVQVRLAFIEMRLDSIHVAVILC